MNYAHVTTLPFLLDSSHLTPEELAERNTNPALFAARRYGQPEHIFREAAERHENGSLQGVRPAFLAAYSHSHSTPRPVGESSEASQRQQPAQVLATRTRPSSTSPPSHHSSPGSATTATYFSTVLSQPSPASPTPGDSRVSRPDATRPEQADQRT